jgi:MFS family permease
MAGATSGAALGVLINGVLIQTSGDLHSWRVSFFIATAAAIAPTVAALAMFRAPVPRPQSQHGAALGAGYRAIFRSRAGRVIVGAPLVAGAVGFPFTAFLTATAIDEMGVSALSAAALWWVIGALGTLAGPVIGRYGDRTSPLWALTGGAIAFAAGLATLAASWTYVGLVVAAAGLSVVYYPIWGLVGAVANRYFDSQVAVRAITLGLVGAAGLGAAANAAAGAWIDRTSSFRTPVAVLAAIMIVMGLWQLAVIRRGGLEPEQRPAVPAYDQ